MGKKKTRFRERVGEEINYYRYREEHLLCFKNEKKKQKVIQETPQINNMEELASLIKVTRDRTLLKVYSKSTDLNT